MNLLNLFQLLVLFLIGTSIGSFLNVVIDRFPEKRSILRGRSYCENCKKQLSLLDLIPLASFIFLKGKCRHCKSAIPSRIFIVELISGIALLYLFLLFGVQNLWILVVVSIIVFILLAIFFIDLEHGIIPDKLVLPLTLFAMIYVYLAGFDYFNHLISGVGALLFFLSLFAVTKGRGMGFGDVKLSFALGIILGFPMVVYGLYLAFLTGAIVSIILVIWRKKNFRKSMIPFGPFLVASAIFSMFFGESIIIPLVRVIF